MNTIKLIIDSPVKNSSMIYASSYYCLDPFILIDYNGKKYGWLPSTEIEKAKLKSKIDFFYNISEESIKLKEKSKYPSLKSSCSSLIIDWLYQNDIKLIYVPESFPLTEAENLSNYGFQVKTKEEPFYDDRVIKTDHEIQIIKNNTKKNEEVMKEVYNILAESDITNDKKLKYKNEILTSEFLQNYILKSFIDKNMISDNVIVAIGNQGCYPHEHGQGEVFANTSIIVDIYPRNRSNLYWTDMTRTFCKGKADDDLKKIYKTVLEVQLSAISKVHARELGSNINSEIKEIFRQKGFKTGLINGILQGFIHGTGHGIGLDCHELPYISQSGKVLPENSIVSVEPGLYYLNQGSVRIEDLVVVKEGGCENLNAFHKEFEIE